MKAKTRSMMRVVRPMTRRARGGQSSSSVPFNSWFVLGAHRLPSHYLRMKCQMWQIRPFPHPKPRPITPLNQHESKSALSSSCPPFLVLPLRLQLPHRIQPTTQQENTCLARPTSRTLHVTDFYCRICEAQQPRLGRCPIGFNIAYDPWPSLLVSPPLSKFFIGMPPHGKLTHQTIRSTPRRLGAFFIIHHLRHPNFTLAMVYTDRSLRGGAPHHLHKLTKRHVLSYILFFTLTLTYLRM